MVNEVTSYVLGGRGRIRFCF